MTVPRVTRSGVQQDSADVQQDSADVDDDQHENLAPNESYLEQDSSQVSQIQSTTKTCASENAATKFEKHSDLVDRLNRQIVPKPL